MEKQYKQVYTLAKLVAGDRFYFLNDKKKEVKVVTETKFDRFYQKVHVVYYSTDVEIAQKRLADNNRKPDEKQVVYLRSSNN